MITKESAIELQKIDCNCNDCIHMARDIVKATTYLVMDRGYQLEQFRNMKARAIRKARAHKDLVKREAALKDAIALSHTYIPQGVAVNYGWCEIFKKEVNFLPNTLQFDTQECFKHRRS
jgi:hypothetical protein